MVGVSGLVSRLQRRKAEGVGVEKYNSNPIEKSIGYNSNQRKYSNTHPTKN